MKEHGQQQKPIKLTILKALGTYLCWVRRTTRKKEVQELNCYLETEKVPFNVERAKQVTDGSMHFLNLRMNSSLSSRPISELKFCFKLKLIQPRIKEFDD